MKPIGKKRTAAGEAMTIMAEKNAMIIEAFMLTIDMILLGRS